MIRGTSTTGPFFDRRTVVANIGPNNGQKLRWPLKSFTEMLIREARWVSGMTYEQLDEALSPPGSIWCGQTYRYAKKDRAPLASAIQSLEQRVADLTKRKARRIAVFEGSNRKFVGYPEDFHELGRKRLSEQFLRARFLFLAYEDGWPTFFDLVDVNQTRPDGGIALAAWCWQWGLLWEKGWPGLERSAFGFSADEPLQSVIRALVHKAEAEMPSLDASRQSSLTSALEWQLHRTSQLQAMPTRAQPIERGWVDGDRTADDFLAGCSASNVVDLPASRAASRRIDQPVFMEVRKGVYRWGRLV